MIGTCEDCQADGISLRFKPDVPADTQSQPSICDHCRSRREELMVERRRDRGRDIPRHVSESEIWERDGGEGLPVPMHDQRAKVWLFTCRACGKRWANPPAPVAGCGCGSEDITCHRFRQEEYLNIKRFGDPAGEDGDRDD